MTLTIIDNANVYAPTPLGMRTIVIGGGRVLAISTDTVDVGGMRSVDGDVVRVDARGRRVIPGLIDCHVHLTGGGGESGASSRVPRLMLSSLTTAGITSVVGLLGTDCTTRTMRDLVATVHGLRDEGLSAWCWTGGYAVPVNTLTNSVRDDITFVDSIIGVGELAISDHRSSQPTFDEFVRIAADCHVSGLMTGKAGVLHLHLGDGARGLGLVRRALDETELPPHTFHPTHVNRKRALFEEAIALAKRGVTVDVTAFDPGDDGVSVEDCVERFVTDGVDLAQLTISSDGAGCLPTFNAQGELVHMDIGQPHTMTDALTSLLSRGHALEAVLAPFSSSVARALRLRGKGEISVGGAADLVILDEAHRVSDVIAGGVFMVRDGQAAVRGMFE